MTNKAETPAPAPGLWQTTGLVLGLRFRLFGRRLTRRGAVGTALAVVFAAGLSLGLGAGGYLLFSAVPAIATEPVWMAFATGLFYFLLGLFWLIWPVIAAQVDEAYELGRFFVYPVRPARLYLIQSVAGLAEPAVLFFYPALLGSGLGLAQTLAPGAAATAGLMAAFTLMHVACGRCLQNLFLNVMKSRRSGEFLFAGLLLFLGLSAFIPPVDASWLFARFGAAAASPEDLALLARTAHALGNTPPGWLAYGLAASAAGSLRFALGCGLLMLAVAGAAWMLGLVLLKRFYRGGRGWTVLPSRARRPRRPARTGWRLPGVSGPVCAVFEKELKTLLSSPKARLLVAVPFFLLILLKIIGAAPLFRYLWGDTWAAVVLALLGAYVLSVLAGQFFSNGFGYDGPGVRQVFSLPQPPGVWLAGRNLAQAALALAQFTGLGLLLFVLMPGAGVRAVALPVTSFPFGLLVLLGLGNLLGARYPRRFHMSLARRDRPVGASFVWVLACLGGCTLVVLAMTGLAPDRGAGLWVALAPLPLLGAGIYALLLPVAARWTRAGRERIIDAIGRP